MILLKGLNDKILDSPNLKALADNKVNEAPMTIFVSDTVENTVGRGENAGYQHLPIFSTTFLKTYFVRGSLKTEEYAVGKS